MFVDNYTVEFGVAVKPEVLVEPVEVVPKIGGDVEPVTFEVTAELEKLEDPETFVESEVGVFVELEAHEEFVVDVEAELQFVRHELDSDILCLVVDIARDYYPKGKRQW